ncbi:TMhelix containing protein [Vibrio phage 1.189.B._10N.286.51.B5]|nr:TMhelix containing protein [Vibrio phage 1.189.B._10N.286.51.B5]AUR93958.1 TMhelix containing protein [Vibrio phage 1.189.C._10N.286.51.B5]AUR94024.1 TMhelix containing protein [Vibrio phage 1.189.O._10N.286.51.B5]
MKKSTMDKKTRIAVLVIGLVIGVAGLVIMGVKVNWWASLAMFLHAWSLDISRSMK